MCHRQRRGPQRVVRRRVGGIRRRPRHGCRQAARHHVGGHVVGVGGDGPRHGLGLPARPGVSRRVRTPCSALSARVAGHRGTPGDGGGEEPPARRQQPQGPVALRDHHGAGHDGADRGDAVPALRLRPAERRGRRAGARRRRRGGPLHRPAGVDPWCGHRAGLRDASAQAGHDDIHRDGSCCQAGVLHGRHDAVRCRRRRSSRFFHRHRVDQL